MVVMVWWMQESLKEWLNDISLKGWIMEVLLIQIDVVISIVAVI